jgi:hypothetical protein
MMIWLFKVYTFTFSYFLHNASIVAIHIGLIFTSMLYTSQVYQVKFILLNNFTWKNKL